DRSRVRRPKIPLRTPPGRAGAPGSFVPQGELKFGTFDTGDVQPDHRDIASEDARHPELNPRNTFAARPTGLIYRVDCDSIHDHGHRRVDGKNAIRGKWNARQAAG